MTAAIRVFVVAYFRAASTEDGHSKAGHGPGAVLWLHGASNLEPLRSPRLLNLHQQRTKHANGGQG